MKKDFKNLNFEEILKKRIVFLYGNFSEFISFFSDIFINTLDVNEGFKKKVITCADFLKEELTQTSLFSSEINLYNIENVQDNNYQDLIAKIDMNGRDIFFLESGDYKKSKQATDYFLDNESILAIPLFKNSFTCENIFKKLIPNISKLEMEMLSKLLENSNENINSLIQKVSLLKSYDQSQELIKQYYVNKEHFFNQFEPIPLLRYLAAVYSKDQDLNKLAEELNKPQDLKFKDILEKCLLTEVAVKKGKDITVSDILNILFLTK